MNKPATITSVLLATATAGVALFAIADLATHAGFAISETFSFAAAAALVGFAIADYSRRPKALRLPAPTARAIAAVAAGPRGRAAAYGLPRNRNQRVAV